ncbi:hypothetical protein NUH86_18855 [Sphingobium sp. JS3065]|uniref:hypothetical protein n=1 Tax=Sphingobium sp. JS3065 TaxID=2970925 RepID=UPI0022649B65|nr:hypothetical protein [Sphingobium sp. JS3065]UZW57636.1 hypothetical protein NUH86_18855 [Sphingobium sp. JS3065]
MLTDDATGSTGAPQTRDYFAEMYVAGILADAGWDVYFPRRDKGFDMIVSRPSGASTIVRPVQVKGKYSTDEKTDKARYGYVGRVTAFHNDMILAMPYFTSQSLGAPMLIAWMPRGEIKQHSKGWRCEPARFVGGVPEARPGFAHFFGAAGLSAFEAEVGISII